jgi:thiosulfate/3-mercaptopyruvate sulfurtransferase
MPYSTHIPTAALDDHLGDSNWAVFDCRFQLKDPGYGRRLYEEAHVPGAVYADLNEDLSGPISPGKTSRHPLPTVEDAAQTFSALGIDANTQVVAYDDQGGALAAARLWWMLRWLGHGAVAVLDGGWQKWELEGRNIRSGPERRPPRTFVPHPRPEMLIGTEEVLRSLGETGLLLVDARTAERYRGENEIIDPVAGHIPGAVSAPYPENLTAEGTFKSAEELREKYLTLLANRPASRAGFYCGSGGTAPHSILAILHAGLGEAKLYAGSWSEWIIDPERPIATGDEDHEGARHG